MLSSRLKMPLSFYAPGSVVFIDYPYEDKKKKKMRPAVILEVSDDEFVALALKISSSTKLEDEQKHRYAVEIQDIASAGLSKRSWVLTDKVLKVSSDTNLILKGHLTEQDFSMIKGLHDFATENADTVVLDYDDKEE